MARKDSSFYVKTEHNGDTSVSLSGSISIFTADRVFISLMDILKKETLGKIKIDLSGVDYLDTTGALMLVRIEEEASKLGFTVEYENMNQKIKAMMDLIDRSALKAPPVVSEKRTLGFIERLGEESINLLKNIKEVVSFGGELLYEILYSLLHPKKIRGGDLILYMKKVGVDGLPIIGLISFLLGLILAFMSSLQLKQFGANIYVPSLLSIAMVRELGPIMTAILVTGRSGSAFAAEIGTMKVNEEVDALITMGLNPIRFLAIPKIFAAVIVMPFLTLFSDISAFIGGMLIGVTILDLTIYTYIQQTVKAIDVFNILISLFKSMVLAILIAGIGCQRGFTVTGGAQGVGNATTSAVVAGLFLIIIVDSIFAIVLNYI